MNNRSGQFELFVACFQKPARDFILEVVPRHLEVLDVLETSLFTFIEGTQQGATYYLGVSGHNLVSSSSAFLNRVESEQEIRAPVFDWAIKPVSESGLFEIEQRRPAKHWLRGAVLRDREGTDFLNWDLKRLERRRTAYRLFDRLVQSDEFHVFSLLTLAVQDESDSSVESMTMDWDGRLLVETKIPATKEVVLQAMDNYFAMSKFYEFKAVPFDGEALKRTGFGEAVLEHYRVHTWATQV